MAVRSHSTSYFPMTLDFSNTGSALSANLRAAQACIVTNLAASVGGVTWMLWVRLRMSFHWRLDWVSINTIDRITYWGGKHGLPRPSAPVPSPVSLLLLLVQASLVLVRYIQYTLQHVSDIHCASRFCCFWCRRRDLLQICYLHQIHKQVSVWWRPWRWSKLYLVLKLTWLNIRYLLAMQSVDLLATYWQVYLPSQVLLNSTARHKSRVGGWTSIGFS